MNFSFQQRIDMRYRLNGNAISRSVLRPLPDRVKDLLHLSVAVYTEDRRTQRVYRGAKTGQRHIPVSVPVREVEFWKQSEVLHRLQEYLYWLSEDLWSIEFKPWQNDSDMAQEQFLMSFPPDYPARVSLFSGGLDSLAGFVAQRSKENGQVSNVLVSGVTHNRIQSQQSKQIEGLRRTCQKPSRQGCDSDIIHLPVHFGIENPKLVENEKSQRTRSFAFLAFGAAAAMQVKSVTVYVYENGIGALNLPLNAMQLGVDNARGTHPRSLNMAANFLELVLDQEIRIENPFLFTTKAEMCKAILTSGLGDIVQHTVSCDGFPPRLQGKSQCGKCTSCILRREALYNAGLKDSDHGYKYQHDFFENPEILMKRTGRGFPLMLEQVRKMESCLDSSEPWGRLVATYPELARTSMELETHWHMCSKEIRSSFMKLFKTYVQEWAGLVEALQLSI